MIELGRDKKPSPGRGALPFDAIVGQAELKRALLLVAANDDLGGLLVRGEKGTAKSTAVRALAELLPEQQAVADCPFGCDPADPTAQCADCRERADPPIERRPVPLVTLPLGATRERVVGSLSVADALDGDRAFDPGLLARANRGILYVDEVNLLDDHLVDVLLDAAADGVNRVERDGVSVSHPADVTLIGTMNPEEGDLRPQLRDRFALQATVAGCEDLDDRVAIIERALERDEEDGEGGEDTATDGSGPPATERVPSTSDDPADRSEPAGDRSSGDRLRAARDLLDGVELPGELAREIAGLCRDAGVDGHRGDIATARTARTLAALDRRRTVLESDVREAAELALPHRLRSKPFEEPPDLEELLDDCLAPESGEDDGRDGDASADGTADGREDGTGGASDGDRPESGDRSRPESADAADGGGRNDPNADRDGGSEDGKPGEDGRAGGEGGRSGGGGGRSGGEEGTQPRSAGADADGESPPDGADDPANGASGGDDSDGDEAGGGGSDTPTPIGRAPGRDGDGSDDGSSADAAGSTDGEGDAESGAPLVPGQSRDDPAEARAPALDPSAEGSDDAGAESGGSRRTGTDRVGSGGPRVRTEPAEANDPVDAAASVRAAAARESDAVESRDLRRSVRASEASALVLFVVDASASMRGPMRRAKGVALELLEDAYAARDRVGLVAFAGDDAEVLLPPTDSVTLAARHLKGLPTGDRTPLAAGLRTAGGVLDRADPAASVVVTVTDGRANAGGANPTAETRGAAQALAERGAEVVVVDAGEPGDRAALTGEIVETTGGRRIPLDALTAEAVDGIVADERSTGGR